MSHGTNLSDIGDAFVHFEFVPQGLLSFYWLATQLSWSEEFELASLASRQKWRGTHIFKNFQESLFKHDEASLSPILGICQITAIWRKLAHPLKPQWKYFLQ
ncbi:MAG: hypothetical protein DMG89_14820 [Acidobacteria bacterium]|nr:MAG: hypothetical protein DMG89_14820 [Acidobacteriota bacterium]